MCIACDWAPQFARFGSGTKPLKRMEFGESAVAGAGLSRGPGTYADFVFHNGPVYTLCPSQPWATALAVTGATISYVGDSASALAQAGPGTRVVDLDGRLLMPGFVEGHIHPFLGSFVSAGADLQVPTRADALNAIAAYAAQNPDGPVRGFGWRVDMFGPEGPNRADLDEILPDRPAFFFAIDGHSLWVNSAALETSGVGRDTPDPIPGFSFFYRDSDGEPTGYVLEAAAMLSLVNGIEPITLDSMRVLLRAWISKASAAGITSLFDAGVPPIGSDQADLIRIYTELESAGALPFRVAASYFVNAAPADDAVDMLTVLREEVATELVQVGVLKILGDGTQGGYTAWLLEPYADKPDSVGESPFTERQWYRLVGEADAAGFDVHVHACGDRTTRIALDAIEEAIKTNPPRDRRHAIAHLVYVDDSDNRRFGALGVIAQFSANWFSADPDTTTTMRTRYGTPRQELLYRPREVLNAGGRISFGTDWPASGYFSTYKPLDSIQIAVTRQLIGHPDGPVLAPENQRLSVAEAVHANTLGAAYQIGLDKKVGSLEVGKRADLVMLGSNIFEVDPHDIHRSPVEMTMMNGVIRHEG